MASHLFVALVEVLTLVTCAMLIPRELENAWRSVKTWKTQFLMHPTKALRSIWLGFWSAWLPVLTVSTLIYAFALAPSFTGYGLSQGLFIVANLLVFIRCCIAEELHGTKGDRKAPGERASIVAIVFLALGSVSLVECGMVTNAERGTPATLRNIWAASLWWRQSPATSGDSMQNQRSHRPEEPGAETQPAASEMQTAKTVKDPQPAPPSPTPPKEKVEPTEGQIKRESTPKYQALAVAEELLVWFGDVRKRVPEFEDWNAELFRLYPETFRGRLRDMSAKLQKCGADTTRLDSDLNTADGPYKSVTHLEALYWDLRHAAYDIPGGQPECGTKASTTTGFREKDTGMYVLKTSGTALGMDEDELEKGPHSPMQVHGMDLFKVYLLNGHFYVDTTLYAGHNVPSVKIERNEVAMDNPYLDRNFTDRALEVVDQNGVPLLQMIFETDRQIVINGVFLSPDGKSAVIITPTTSSKVDIDSTGERKINVPLSPLFKYPSWKYQGVYANN